ncbi:MAG: phospholipid carrier-dependent glycosyltransferase [bacterium]|nr:phospholipid carrier-dependent glycosyltransferase [bacterium]
MWKTIAVIILLTTSFLIRAARIDYPSTYVFDEVYHAWTARAYSLNDPRGYEWWHTSSKQGTAYEWLHPPIAKLFQASAIRIFGDTSFSWRIWSVVFGTAAVGATFLLTRVLFKRFDTAFLAALFVAFDPLVFVQSRIAMNDIFVTTFLLASAWAWWKWTESNSVKWMLLSAVLIGLAVSTKWSALYGWGVLILLTMVRLFIFRSSLFKILAFTLTLVLVPLLIYVISFSQFWLQGHSIKQFIELHQQIWWYQTNLKATHPYQSAAWMWPFAMRPVWYFVEYGKDTVANIYAAGNVLTWLLGLMTIVWALVLFVVKKGSFSLVFVLVLYTSAWMPWLLSPRILFLYHYLPAIPFLMILLAHFFTKTTSRSVCISLAVVHVIIFLLLYPRLAGLHISTTINLWYTFF